MVQLEFELAYYDATVQHMNHYATEACPEPMWPWIEPVYTVNSQVKLAAVVESDPKAPLLFLDCATLLLIRTL